MPEKQENRIAYHEKPYPDKAIYETFNPLVEEWWKKTFKEFAPPQKFSIINIHNRENTLVSSPTGSGKTLSAFTAILNELTDLDMKGILEDKVYAVYISPLKALGNDIEKNLNEPLQQLNELFKEKYATKKKKELSVRVAVRTGDTSTSDRSKMLRKPPHILITTPESLAIMLTTTKFREKLADTEWVIVDEVHSMADNKRGVHLSISLERLQRITSFTRIGLSATVSPLEEVAKFLVGYEDPDKELTRPCKIVDVNYIKKLNLKVLSPVQNLIKSSFNDIHASTYNLINELIQKHRTTLIFTNTRSATERVVHQLKERFPKQYTKIKDLDEETDDDKSFIGAHHGSLSKELRKNIEDRLKNGELKAVVSSTSLELGIDIGYIDLVILLGSPKSVARALQRIGRSGHKLHDEAKGRIIVLDRDDLVECSVLLKAALEKKIDRIMIPRNVFDVLAQQVFGIAIEESMKAEEAYKTIRNSYCYKDLTREDFNKVIKYLSGEYVSLEDRNVYAKIWYDEETGMIGKRGKLARVLYMTNIGTIPDETSVKVKLDKQYIGSIAEPFLEKLRKGDVFVLGGQTYEFRYAQGMTAYVKTSVNRPPTVPSWFSEMLPLSFDLAMEIQKFRRFIEELFLSKSSKKDIMEFINTYLYVDEYGANSIYEYFREQYMFAEVPHDKKLVIEHYDDSKNKYIVFHSLYGRRTNDVLSRAFAFILGRIHGKDIELNINDNGFYLMVPSSRSVQVSRAFSLLTKEDLRLVMKHALEKTEVLGRRFRHCAARALMILRSYKGRSKSVGKQQLNSRLLISAVKKIDEDFIILREARREVLEDLMDVFHAEEVLKSIHDNKLSVKEIYTDIPSPFAFNLITMGYSDIMKMDDKQQFLRNMHNQVLAKIALKEARSKN